MAFGVLRRVFGGRGEAKETRHKEKGLAAPAKKSLAVSEVSDWLESQFGAQLAKERKGYSSMAEGLVGSMHELQKRVQGIRHKSFEGGDKTYAAVNMIKDTWAKKAVMSFSSYKRALEGVSLSAEGIDFPAFRELYQSTLRLLNEITMIPRQKVVLTRYFESESKKMAETLQKTGGLMDRMKAEMEGSGLLQKLEHVKGLIKGISGTEDAVESSIKGLEDAVSRISQKKGEIAKLGDKLQSIEDRPEWKELERIESEARKLLSRKEEIEGGISADLGSLKRVFKLYSHDACGLGKAERKLVTDLSKSPLKAFLSSDPGSLSGVLKRLSGDIKEGKFGLSEKDRAKAPRLESLLEGGRIAKARQEHRDVMSEMESLQHKKAGIKIAVEKGEQGRLLERAKAELAVLEREKAGLQSELAVLERELGGKRKELADYIKQGFGRTVRLK